MTSEETPLPLSPLNPLAAEIFLEREKKGLKGNGRRTERTVCSCGHSMNYHARVGEVSICTPAKMDCKCKVERPVLVADNLRMFLNNTSGVGVEHALGKGLVASVARKVNFSWVESPLRCDMCMGEMSEPIPVAVSLNDGMPTDKSTGVDKIVCMTCYVEWTSGLR